MVLVFKKVCLFSRRMQLNLKFTLYFLSLVYQVKLREMKPGMLSQELKEALGMPEGAPPPWLINMQVRIPNFLCLAFTSVSVNFFTFLIFC
jgi:hypothetical protein